MTRNARFGVLAVVSALVMAALAGWLTGALWLFWFVVANIGAQRFSGRLAKFWPVLCALLLAVMVLALRAAFSRSHPVRSPA